MKVATTRFGEFDIAEDQLFMLSSVLPGFPNTKRFFYIQRDNIKPFQWMQSVEEPDVTFVVVDPASFFMDYNPSIPKSDLAEIDLNNQELVELMAIVVLPEDMTKMTANLKGPLIINREKRVLKQIFLETERWSVRESILEGIRKKEQALIEQKVQQEAQK
ncbi:MAG TPA: flagellar assembly protein FliW [bacterium]|nr:flagellar assembly protein FliW [bacterium]